eukprot:gene7847-9208_t
MATTTVVATSGSIESEQQLLANNNNTNLLLYVSPQSLYFPPPACGFTSDLPCQSIADALVTFNITIAGAIESSLTLLLADGIYTGANNTMINVYGMNITLEPFNYTSSGAIFQDTVQPIFVHPDDAPNGLPSVTTMLTLININTYNTSSPVVQATITNGELMVILINCQFSTSNATQGAVLSLISTESLGPTPTPNSDSSSSDQYESSSTSTNNEAVTHIMLLVQSSEFSDNEAEQNGGAIFMQGVEANIFDSVFVNNSVLNIYGMGQAIYTGRGSLVMHNTTFEGPDSSLANTLYFTEQGASVGNCSFLCEDYCFFPGDYDFLYSCPHPRVPPTPLPRPPPRKWSQGEIIGATIGCGVAFILIVVLGSVAFNRRLKKERRLYKEILDKEPEVEEARAA